MDSRKLNLADKFPFFLGIFVGFAVYWGGFLFYMKAGFFFSALDNQENILPDFSLISFLNINLGYSLVAFLFVIILYGHYIFKLKRGLSKGQLSILEIKQLLTRIHTLSGLFFGIGVLWTAIGMRSALLSALGDLDEHSAAQLGAFEILRRLVDGGILVALSTTIVGGFGGYLMKLIETFYVSADVQAYFDNIECEKQEKLLALLGRGNDADKC